MTVTPTARKKLSKSGWILIGIGVVLLIALPILHFTGVYDLSFLGSGYISIMMWASENGWNALIVGVTHFILGMLTFYALKSYIIGEKQVFMAGYNPSGQTVPQQQGTGTVVS